MFVVEAISTMLESLGNRKEEELIMKGIFGQYNFEIPSSER